MSSEVGYSTNHSNRAFMWAKYQCIKSRYFTCNKTFPSPINPIYFLHQPPASSNTVNEEEESLIMTKHKNTKPSNHSSSYQKPQNPFSAFALGPKKTVSNKPPKMKNKKTKGNAEEKKKKPKQKRNDAVLSPSGGAPTASASEQIAFFIRHYQLENKIQLYPIEMESLTEKCMLELHQNPAQNAGNLGEYLKPAFGKSWREVLCEKQVQEGKVEPGNPALLVVSSSAIKSLELLRELRPLTGECKPAKLFAKHMKIEEQVSFLKNRINVASGTPSRIKKLIDLEALGLSRLSVVVIDLDTDVKGYNLLSLPQVRDEFWDLYRSHFHKRVLDGDMRICFYSQRPKVEASKDDEE